MELAGRLSALAAPFELYAFPDAPHIKAQPRHKFAAYERNLDWFRFWLKGETDPAPVKAAQYARWRELTSPAQAQSQERSQSSRLAISNKR